MRKLTLFSWGYWGWGNATSHLVEWVNAVEAARGFNPPVFVDVRISRSVRAQGFRDNAFGELLGPERYQHMPSLGNLSILGQTGPAIQIKDPASARRLLDLASQLAETRQRLLFFCSCEYPRLEGDPDACHRVTVARLVLEAAPAARPIEIVEWPGGEPQTIELEVPTATARKVLLGAKSVPLGNALPGPELAGLAWGSVVRLGSGTMEVSVVVGPPKRNAQGWSLPVPWGTAQRGVPLSDLVAKAREWRRSFGFEPRRSGK